MSATPDTIPEIPTETMRFADAYRRLQGAATRIERAADDDLDTVLDVVREAKQLKAIVDRRWQAATVELNALLEETQP